ncbi:FAD-dependent thymidylate synthase [candidate division KSB3 bacterium]|nr:FAD-dependent thymidylate synthase [candidate division KSB3 bacterium]
MKIIILTSNASLQEQLKNIEEAGRVCYQSQTEDPTVESAQDFIWRILQRGHESVIEHSLLSVKFSGVSRGFTHEMVRHRLCAFSQESTRYVDKGENTKIITKPERLEAMSFVSNNKDRTVIRIVTKPYDEVDVGSIMAPYRREKLKGWKNEDARQFLPIGVATQIVVSANFREWRHIFKLRTGKRAHWEIRIAMCYLLDYLKGELAPIFNDFGSMRWKKDRTPFFEEKSG